MNLSKSYEVFKPEAHSERIHIIGCGSVGSAVAELLARAGLTNITLWDFDTVEEHNIANQMFTSMDVGRPKVEAVRDMILAINPDEAKDKIRIKPKGWQGETLNGYVFLCVDSIELRREIATKNLYNLSVKAMFDFRTRLTDAQHYAADWMDTSQKKDFLSSMEFSDGEASDETPTSACGITLGVAPTVRGIVSIGVANFMNFWNGKKLKKFIMLNAFDFILDAF